MNLFLGGATNWLEYIAKLFVLFTLVLCVNAVYGRFRTDSALRFFWKLPLPMAALGVVFIMFNAR
ncbi:MAG: hypothetical protein A3J97_05180 [Spirochaetes bacterium RIFOXYC1_FULL_54_7]|nr:MAG: hypothetical protein A3J97_05180 [Spirochaetes bacterium RIFOXYC1_FULL_54_7]